MKIFMNFFPKKPYEAFVAPFFVVTKANFSLKNPVFMRVSIPKTHLFIYWWKKSPNSYIWLSTCWKELQCKCLDGCSHSPTMIFWGQIGTWQHKRKQIFKYVNLIKFFLKNWKFCQTFKIKIEKKKQKKLTNMHPLHLGTHFNH
jgi:hypothetical protein